MQTSDNQNKHNSITILIVVVIICFLINPLFGILSIYLIVTFIKKRKNGSFGKNFIYLMQKMSERAQTIPNFAPGPTGFTIKDLAKIDEKNTPVNFVFPVLLNIKRLEKRKKYLHIALNSTLDEARDIISRLPKSDRILIEAGTPLIKIYGVDAITQIKAAAPSGSYIVADNKCSDLASREVEMMANAGANAVTCLGVAPIETIDSFIEECEKFDIDSMIDMMNVEDALSILKRLKKLPNVVILHRGVDEGEFSKEKAIPYYQIKQIKGNYNILVAVAGGDDIKEVQRAIFNDADIVVVWKNFYQMSVDTAQLAQSFLQEVK